MNKTFYIFLIYTLPLFICLIFFYLSKTDHADQGVEYSKNKYSYLICYSFNTELCKNPIKQDKKNIVLLGNSQLTAINSLKTDDFSVCARLIKHYEDNPKVNFTCYSLPNLNPEEIKYIYKNYLYSNEEDLSLIIPLFYDDFVRERGIRGSILSNNFSTFETKKKDQKKNNYFHEIIKKNKEIIQANLIYVRNFLFNVDEFSIRKKIPHVYKNNLNFFYETIYLILQKRNTQTFIYFAPMRDDYKLPFNISDYDDFKNEIFSFVKNKNIQFENFENIIKSNFFGLDLNNKVDFIHFKNEGHKILTNGILKLLDDF